MEWMLTLTSVVVVFLVAPLVLLLGGLMLFGLVGHVLPRWPMVSRASFNCPFSKRRASVEFLTSPGAEGPSDVLSRSVFAPRPYHIRCEKGCLGLAKMGWMSSPMMPRYALLSGGVAYRAVRPPEHAVASETPKPSVARVA